MKIIFLDAVQNFGGSQRSTVNLIRNIKNEHSTLYVDFWGIDSTLLETLKINNIDYKILNKRDSPIIIKERKNLFLLIKNLLKFTQNYLLLRKRFKVIQDKFKPDLIIVNNTKSLSIIPKSDNTKVILFIRTWFANQRISKFKKYLFSKADYFFAVSNATKFALYAKEIADLKNIYTLPNSINLNRPYKKIVRPFKKLRILNCGGYTHTKGLHHTLEIARELKNRNDIEFQIDIVGHLYKGERATKYYKKLQSFLLENNLEDQVILHKNIRNIQPFYEEANILLHPTYTEGLPRVVMEAMSNSIPVVANSVGGINDYILDGFTGFLAGFNDIDKFIEKIYLLNNNLELYNFITANAYKLIEVSYNDTVQKNNINSIFGKLSQ